MTAMRAAGILLLALAAGEDANPEAAVLKKIENLRARASKLKVDGRSKDWEGFPFFEDRDTAAFPYASLDIRRAAIAPREEDLLVVIETVGVPSRSPLAFGLDIDFLGMSARDARIQFGANEVVEATVYPERGNPTPAFLRREEISFGEVVEIRVPLAPLAVRIGGEEGKAWLEGNRRSFVRVQVWSAVKGVEGPADTGPAAASFRLAAPPLFLDPPLRPDGEPRRAVRLPLPLKGMWFVRQGPHGLWSHAGLWAYDLCIEDHALSPTAVPGSRRLEDYYAWGKHVIAPEAGAVVFDSGQVEDCQPLGATAGRDCGNTLIVRLADGMRLSFGHLRKDSQVFPRGGQFPAGAVLACVGNSGDSGAPHLHLSLHERPGEFVGLPLAFKDVRVGLNPGADDPWARDLATWAVREGWFVAPR